MIVSIHQPHFLPWPGYFNKVIHSDVFVWLHSVQYRKNYFQNRTKIKNGAESPFWLTLPVHAKLELPIDQVIVADPTWRTRIQRTIEQSYRKTPFFEQCWPALSSAFQSAPDTLDGVNYQSFMALLQLLDVQHVRVVRAEEIPVVATDPTKRLVDMCEWLGATHYIAGKGGHNYLRAGDFAVSGIQVIWQDFDPTCFVYPQKGHTFLEGLSVVDCLFNIGPENTRELVENAWMPCR